MDSLGDVQYMTGHWAEAEAFYLQAQQRDANFLGGATMLKAAMARLMTGDVAGADGLAERFFAARVAAHDPIAPYRQAEWQWTSGRRQEAVAQLLAFARASESGPLREIASNAYAELALWKMQLGDRAGAQLLVERAAATAKQPTVALVLARFLAQPQASAAEWAARAGRAFPQPAAAPLRSLALAYALLLAKEFGAAAPVLQGIYDSPQPGGDESLPVLLAWADLESGHVDAAAPLLAVMPSPPVSGLAPFAGFWFPRVVYLRGLLAEKQGKADVARREYGLFLKLSGNVPMAWGEEGRAAGR
jgi:tetratricopeptide (TPR) repeat protein